MSLGKKKSLHQAAVSGFNASENFAPFIWTGNGTARSITGTGVDADLMFLKSRTQGNYNPKFMDNVRGSNGGSVMENLYTSLTNAQANDNGITSLDSDGFSVNATGDGNVNTIDYVGHFWKGGGNSNIYNIDGTGYSTSAAAGLASGSVAPSGASVNTAAGFSIITFAGASGAQTVEHGLSTAPELMIMKSYDVGGTWGVYVKDLGANKYLELNSTASQATSTTAWNNTHPTGGSNGVFSWQGGIIAGGSGYNNVAYLWHSVAGYSKIGTYVGTGGSISAIDVGFQPRYVMIKSTGSTSGNWAILDSLREGTSKHQVNFNTAAAEFSNQGVTFTSTGFSPRQSLSSDTNTSGVTFVYMAFA